MTDYTDLSAKFDALFDENVEHLQDDYDVEHDDVCDICRCDHEADLPITVEQASSISRTAIVKTKTCPSPHIFHKLCLCIWMHTNLHGNGVAACPMCRTNLISQSPLEALRWQLRTCNDFIESFALLGERIEENIYQHEQDLQRESTNEARRTVLLRSLNEGIALRSFVTDRIAQMQQRHAEFLEDILAITRGKYYRN